MLEILKTILSILLSAYLDDIVTKLVKTTNNVAG